MHSHEAIIATNRFGLGARPGEAGKAGAAPQDWLKLQLTTGDSALIGPGLKTSEEALRDFYRFREQRQKQKTYFFRRAAACIIPGLEPSALESVPLRGLMSLHRWLLDHRPELTLDTALHA